MIRVGLPWILFALTGPYSSVLPFALLPWLTRLSAELITERIDIASLELRWQARLAGLAACIPGIVTLSLVSFSVEYIPRIHPGDLGCYVKLYGPLCIVSMLALGASISWWVRLVRIRRLLASANAPTGALLELAQELNLQVVELPVRVPVCMVVRAGSPCVVVSTGMAGQFSTEELRAALWHEKAHIEHGDLRWNIVISFLSECGVWRVRNALRIHKQACEQLADRRAANAVDGVVLASVLVRFARRSWSLPFAEALAESSGLEQRVRFLLAPPGPVQKSSRAIAFAATLCLVCGCMTAYPKISLMTAHFFTHCIL